MVRGTKAHANDLVSDVDIASEELIVAGLTEDFPDDGVLGEEGTDRVGRSGRRWIIDPIDGTRNYITRSAPWSVCLALQEDGATTVAVVHDPAAGETFTAVTGRGAFLNGNAIHASAEDTLDRALLALTFNPSPQTRGRAVAWPGCSWLCWRPSAICAGIRRHSSSRIWRPDGSMPGCCWTPNRGMSRRDT